MAPPNAGPPRPPLPPVPPLPPAPPRAWLLSNRLYATVRAALPVSTGPTASRDGGRTSGENGEEGAFALAAKAAVPAEAAVAAQGLVVIEHAVGDGQGRAGSGTEQAEAQTDNRSPPGVGAVFAVLAGAAVGAVATAGQVGGEVAVRHRSLAPAGIGDGAPEAPVGAALGGLVAGERAARDDQGRALVIGDAAAKAVAGAGGGADGPVVGERTVRDAESPPEDVGDAAAGRVGAGGEGANLVVVQGHVGEGHAGALVEDAAAQRDGAGRTHPRAV